jgi:transposase
MNQRKEVTKIYDTGIDLHKETSFLTIINWSRKIVTRTNLANDEDLIRDYFLPLREETKAPIESVASWHSLHNLLKSTGLDIVVSNLVKTKAIASSKIRDDSVDAHMLAIVHVSNLETWRLKNML